jgi:CrcB protein
MKSFYPFLLVFLGGGLGAMVRYAAEWIPFGSAFPYSTLLVNVLGSLLLGLLFAFTKPGFMGPMLTLFLGVGIMGGFTTFSGFSLHSIKLVEQAQYGVLQQMFCVTISFQLLPAGLEFQQGAGCLRNLNKFRYLYASCRSQRQMSFYFSLR